MFLEVFLYRLISIATIYNIFGSLGDAPIEDVEKSIERTCDAEDELIEYGIKHNEYGICESCGGQCTPWFFECDKCHQARMAWRHDRYGGWDDEGW